ncbi:MAG: cobalamin B12-binding domain-containing protein [Thermodesulfobacteriota bacterium]
MERRIKVLLAKLGLDVHDRGVITVAKELRDAGMEVVYIGNALPKEIVAAAGQEAPDVVGVSSLGGAHLSLGQALMAEAAGAGLTSDTVFMIGGVFSPADAAKLKDLGFAGVFPPGSGREEIVGFVNAAGQAGR